jgi:2-amino-4-hydroxy-6-hydroxymethyldihydropteridine diphosphokinase
LSDPTEVSFNKYLLSLGSNIDPDENIARAGTLLSTKLNIISVSSVWKTKAVGSDGPDFLNAMVLAESKLAPFELKTKLLSQIENDLGRIRTADKNSPRTIDIDIVMVNEKITDQDIWANAHISVPASEIYPNIPHPETGIPLRDLANMLADRVEVLPAANLDLNILINQKNNQI